MNKRKGKKIAVIAAVVMGFMVIAFLPAASATVTSFTVTPGAGLAGAVDSYNVLVTTDGVTTINITIPAGFIAVTPTTGGVQIARVDFWNSSTKAYYGYATITANNADPTTKVDIHCDFGGLTVSTTQTVNYDPGAINTFESGFGSDTSSAVITLPTETVDGSIKINITCTEFQLDDVMIAIGQSVRNPKVADWYHFYADGKEAPVNIISQEGRGSCVFRNGRWYIDTDGDHKTNIYFRFGDAGDIAFFGEFGSEDYGVFRGGHWCKWYIDTDWDQKDNIFLMFGDTGDLPVVGDFNGDGTDDYGVFRGTTGRWYIDTNFDQKTDISFAFGVDGDLPIVGDFNGDGIDDPGVFRDGHWCKWYIDTNFDQKTDITFAFGDTGDLPVVGDLTGDGRDDYGVFRNGRWYIDTDFDQRANLNYWYGTTGDQPLVYGG